MRTSSAHPSFTTSLSLFAAYGLIVLACGSRKGGIDTPADGGSTSQGGTQEPAPQDGGAGFGAGGTGDSSRGGTGNDPTPQNCHFYTDPPEYEPEEPAPSAAGGEGGGGPDYTVATGKNQFVGLYLVDREGKALYAYGRDFPGDCEYPPISNCYDECVEHWPLFDAVPRLLAPELDPGLFGRIERADGTFQTTYRGWPLYYYEDDVAEGDAKGHAKGVWHLAELTLPNIVEIRTGSGTETRRTLADGGGHTLYVYSEDTLGTESTEPVSACSGACLEDFRPFMLKYLSPVAYVDEKLLSVFVREDGRQQIAYKGAPLYTAAADLRSGDMNGLEHEGFTWAAP